MVVLSAGKAHAMDLVCQIPCARDERPLGGREEAGEDAPCEGASGRAVAVVLAEYRRSAAV